MEVVTSITTPAAPPRRRPMQAAPLASPSVVSEAFRAEERFWTAELKAHRCIRCEFGGPCRTFDYLADMADDYGKKAERAIEQERIEAHGRNHGV